MVVSMPNPGAGLSPKSPPSNPLPVKHGEYSQASRALALGSYFLSGLMAVNASQFLGAPLYLINRDWYNAWIAYTKQSFGLLTTTLTQCWAPTVMKVSGDKSMRGQLLKTTDGNLLCNFPERLVLIANHQIYTDWLYLWWIAYANGMHGRLFIVLKESLRRIPVIGWGMQFSQFIFLKRNWEKDRPNMAKHLQKLNKASHPMWLLLFPEGTNLAPDTRKKSKKWADKIGVPDMQHQLLPRSTGLQFCLQELRETTEYLYDCTIGYEGVPRGQYAQDIFTLKAAYLEGRPPKSVSMYWRRFKISNIPIDDDAAFDKWLRAHWTAKDRLLEGFMQTGRFPAETGTGLIETEVKATRWYEFMQIFAPVGLVALVLYAFYGSLPKKFVKSMNRENVRKKVETIQNAAATPGRLLAAAPSFLSSGQKLPIAPLLKALSAKQLPIASAIKTLAEKNLVIGQIPVGLALKTISDNHLPIATIQSILRALFDTGHLKGALPKMLPQNRLLGPPGVGATKSKQAPNRNAVTAKPSAGTKSAGVEVSRVRALYDFQASEPGELRFREGDIILVLGSVYKDWWKGSLRGQTGMFPVNYVEKLPGGLASTKQGATRPGSTNQAAAGKPQTAQKAAVVKKPQVVQQAATPQKPTPKVGSAGTGKPAPKPAPVAVKTPVTTAGTTAAQKSTTPQKANPASQKPVQAQKANTTNQKSVNTPKTNQPAKPAGGQKQGSTAKPVPKLNAEPKTPLKELTNPSVKTPAKAAPAKQPQAKKLETAPATKPAVTSTSSKPNVKQGAASKPPKLEPNKSTAKQKATNSAAKPAPKKLEVKS